MRILVVEDEENLAESLRQGLSAEGHRVEVAHDGHRGLELALTGGPYDAVLLDLMLPGPGGAEICARMRAHGDPTPVLMLTARDGEHDEAEGLDAGADDYLTKPFSFLVLAARLRALARRAAAPEPTELRAGDLFLDPLDRRCRRGSHDIELTAREAGVLACLMRRTGRAVAKQDVLDEVWDAPHGIDPNIVEVYVSSLRRKIDAPFGRRSILTVHGTGYRMAPDGG
ncbi:MULTISPECIES: response regulator transcription factor [Streptomyces]|uniref:Response regulator transcription factor n=1 Tax=Streptomyces katrae TaxID=68223 RepID=A0ABT7GTH7_9ACTN|nr:MULTISPECIES: response regulator transcription factor [Streptomyces]MDK9496916.1 response regulator transcription factor [Streptomyces katrae]RST01194.1 DNA-binding response regulator [Streptomyces sp. WAC07149]GLX18095.1 DNA-binding response regulator [Streptomyces lavendulae subsp. lavendulae]GLX26439.1 DNA-binding response regulator [Streptomyces lavendulae subsp. lavendulae]